MKRYIWDVGYGNNGCFWFGRYTLRRNRLLQGSLQQLPVERVFDAFWEQFTSGSRAKVFNISLEKLGIAYDDKFITELIRVYRNHVPRISLPQESKDVLCRLNAKYTLALLTDGFLPAQQFKVKALGIEKYFKYGLCCRQPEKGFYRTEQTGIFDHSDNPSCPHTYRFLWRAFCWASACNTQNRPITRAPGKALKLYFIVLYWSRN